jgi:uncharacterized protein
VLKVVLDTNVYIAAVLRPGLSEELVSQGVRGRFTAYVSVEILEEMTSKLREKLSWPISEVRAHEAFLRGHLTVIALPKTLEPIPELRDRQDVHVLRCAERAEADLVITLDRDLLSLGEWHGIRILHPKTFSWIVPPVEE